MRQSHLMLSNALIIWASRALSIVPQLILVPYLISTIGETGYGVYALVWSLTMSIDLLGNSLQEGVVKYSAALLTQGHIQEVNKIVSSSFICFTALAVLACSGILFGTTFYSNSSGRMGSALAIVGIMVLFIIPLTPYLGVIESVQRSYVSAIASTVSTYISLATVFIWFDLMSPSVEVLTIIMLGRLFLSRLAQVPIAYRLVPGLHNRPRLFDVGSFRLIALFGAAMTLVSLCLTANATGVRWLMDALVSPSFVAQLAIMVMPGSLLSQIIGAMTITVMPATSAYGAAGNQQMLKELLLRGMRYTTILVLAALLVAGLLMRSVLSVWVGPGYAFLAPYALTLFAGMAFMEGTSISHHMLKGMGKLRAVTFIYLIGLVVVPAGLILLIFRTWHDPYVAVIAGLTAGYLVCGCLQVGVCIKIVKADFREVLLHSYAQPLMIAAAVYLSAFGAVAISGIDSLAGRTGIAALAIVLFFSGCYSLIATTTERQQVKEIIQAAKRKMVAVPN
ncbi:MAG TPA: hypothetical protein VFL97_08620 [Nitrococcus sp.]|nr:hypothetical protein [Nitrococcus sp.]